MIGQMILNLLNLRNNIVSMAFSLQYCNKLNLKLNQEKNLKHFIKKL